MLETDFTWWTYASWIVIAVSALIALIVLGATKRLLFAAITLGLGIAAGTAVKNLSSDSHFDIAVIKDADGTVTGELFEDEVGGVYTYSDSTSVMLRRGENEPGSFIINDSSEYVFITTVHYIADGLPDSAAPQEEVLVIVQPGETKYTPYRVDYISALDVDPPEESEIAPGASYEKRLWLTWADFEPALGTY